MESSGQDAVAQGGTLEVAPEGRDTRDAHTKFETRSDKSGSSYAAVMLLLDPSLLYVVEGLDNPSEVWRN